MNQACRKLFQLVTMLWLAFFSLQQPAYAQSPIYGASQGPAIEGYDSVAYFTEKKPIQGRPDLSYEWQGASWYFSTPENRELFIAAPEKYAPQYGGHCAFGMANDVYASGDPHYWRIEDNKLYLNTNRFAHWLFERDMPGKIKLADQNWPEKMKKLLRSSKAEKP